MLYSAEKECSKAQSDQLDMYLAFRKFQKQQ